MTRHDLEAKIVKHSLEDEELRREFFADPAGAFVKYLHVPASNLPEILFHEETSGPWHIVVPAKLANSTELSEAALERVAGGVTLPVIIPIPMVLPPGEDRPVSIINPPVSFTITSGGRDHCCE
jgi:hypothetical protein